jgi:hypothetical protein
MSPNASTKSFSVQGSPPRQQNIYATQSIPRTNNLLDLSDDRSLLSSEPGNPITNGYHGWYIEVDRRDKKAHKGM